MSHSSKLLNMKGMTPPEFVASWSEVWVIWTPLNLGCEVRAVGGDCALKPVMSVLTLTS